MPSKRIIQIVQLRPIIKSYIKPERGNDLEYLEIKVHHGSKESKYAYIEYFHTCSLLAFKERYETIKKCINTIKTQRYELINQAILPRIVVSQI